MNMRDNGFGVTYMGDAPILDGHGYTTDVGVDDARHQACPRQGPGVVMSEHVTESIRYAIELPNGTLSSDAPNKRVGNPEYKRMPDGSYAYLWETSELAEANRKALAEEIGFGAGELLERHSRTVEVRVITRTIITPVEGESTAGQANPRTWATSADVPEGVTVRPNLASSHVRFRRAGDEFADARHPYDIRYTAEEIDGDYPGGVVEVLPEPEPRRWAKAADIPHGAKFKGVHGVNVWERSLDTRLAVGLSPRGGMTTAYLDELDVDFPDGFVEVLS